MNWNKFNAGLGKNIARRKKNYNRNCEYIYFT